MKRIRQKPCTFVAAWVAAGFLAAATAAQAADWPQWRGPNRDGMCSEEDLLTEWPSGGPKLLWKATGLGEGFSGPAVIGDRLYSMGNAGGQEWVFCLDLAQRGKPIWGTPIGPVRHNGSGYPGPRSTPTVDGDRLYALGINGDLVCLHARDGKPVWRVNLVKDLGGGVPQWGYSESVLIDGPWVLCTPGGPRATVAALSKADGRPVWASPVGDPAAYSSIVKVSLAQVPQFVTFTAKGIVGVAAKDGAPLWRYDRPANGTANIATCVVYGQTIFAASGYGTGGGTVHVTRTPRGFNAKELYFTRDMQNHHGGVIRLGDYLYGASNPGVLTCINYRTGETVWREREPGKCSILYADGMLICRDQRGPVTLVEATHEGYRQRGRFNQPDRSEREAWPHPVIAGGRLFLRDQDVLLCYEMQ